MTVLHRSVRPAHINLARFFNLFCSFVSTRQHAVRITLVIGGREVTFERFDHFRIVARLFVLFRKAEQHWRVRRIAGEHWFENFDAGWTHYHLLTDSLTGWFIGV